MKLAVWLLLAAAFAGAQAPDMTPRFEVATIKPAAGTPGVSGCYGGPGTASPGQYTCTNATVTDMARKAFDLEFYQLNLKGGDQALWDVAAKIPASATRKQVLLMLQTLLAERFKMVHHIEKREVQVYYLVVGKHGAKLKPAAPDARDVVSMSLSRDGGRHSATIGGMDTIARVMAGEVGRPVIDRTGLAGKFDITLNFRDEGSLTASPFRQDRSPDVPETSLPTLLTAVQEQLGLKMESGKGTIDYFVLDSAAKTPTEN